MSLASCTSNIGGLTIGPVLGMSADDLPLLGESLSVEIANTLYALDEGIVIDVLADPALRRLWLRGVSIGTDLPSDIDDRELDELRRIRDAVHELLRCSATKGLPRQSAVDVVNWAALRSPSVAQLSWKRSTSPRAESSSVGDSWLDRLSGSAAVDAIAVVTGPKAVRECTGPGCRLLFVAHHGRRRFCHPSCSHRARQAAYTQRNHASIEEQHR